MRARGTSVNPRVLYQRVLWHRQAREARAWVEVGDRAHRSRLQRPKGVSTGYIVDIDGRLDSYTRYVSAILPMGKSIV